MAHATMDCHKDKFGRLKDNWRRASMRLTAELLHLIVALTLDLSSRPALFPFLSLLLYTPRSSLAIFITANFSPDGSQKLAIQIEQKRPFLNVIRRHNAC